MDIKRILNWSVFILIIGLIIWGMIAAANKAENENANIATADRVIASDSLIGTTSSPLTIIEYSDFQCTACAAYFPIIERIISDEPNIAFVYRHFPLNQHANAILASQASEASGKQGKFWEMYRLIFENQKNWENSKTAKTIFESYAKELKLDIEKYTSDFNSKEISEKINADQKSGFKAGVNSTPTFFINGKKINNPNSYEEFKKLIEDAAKSGKSS